MTSANVGPEARSRAHDESRHGRRSTSSVSTELASGAAASVSQEAYRPSVLYVCTSCRVSGSTQAPREERPGFKLYQELSAKFRESPLAPYVEVKPVGCLSVCPRPCGIALASPGAWSYIFGDQQPEASADDIMECLSLYIDAEEGAMPREQRPKTLRASILGRVPPMMGGY